ncbi:hypothetical protein FA10DRAFT_133805 [Acaromyces ingoldii]|uniref:Uncharacterized protein n=1 Tax=Acaromyces ingoldii TaxID=215250 RepID=A0A316YHR8_9BASI|nr:hypothetical protein FA10DRAFT_133805 [Acaromyces ingoldii]PWN88977.1 hypothetical protein FA10DRAFT_133805 [Acaromyces ingoldii]
MSCEAMQMGPPDNFPIRVTTMATRPVSLLASSPPSPPLPASSSRMSRQPASGGAARAETSKSREDVHATGASSSTQVLEDDMPPSSRNRHGELSGKARPRIRITSPLFCYRLGSLYYPRPPKRAAQEIRAKRVVLVHTNVSKLARRWVAPFVVNL